jgi:hypothetical protein
MADKRVISLVLNAEKDADIIKWLNSQDGSKSEAIRAAIRARIGTQGITLGDVYQAIREIDRKLARGVLVASDTGAEAPAGDEDIPEDIKDALDNLGL